MIINEIQIKISKNHNFKHLEQLINVTRDWREGVRSYCLMAQNFNLEMGVLIVAQQYECT
jgi:hypothetical protein